MGKIYSNHLHFLSYLLKCPVDNAGNGKEFGACPQTVIPPTSNRVRTSNFFPLRTYFKVLSYAPERDLSEIILLFSGTFVLQRKYSFTLDSQYKWFCSSPKVHFVTELEPLKNSDEYYSLSHSVCVTLKTFWKHYISGSQPNLPSDGGAEMDTISNHSFDFLFNGKILYQMENSWILDPHRLTE